MNWTQEDGYITTGGALRASVKYRSQGNYQMRMGGLYAYATADTEEEAKRIGEEQLEIAKRAFILSLITKEDDEYSFGRLLRIIQVQDIWRVESESDYLFTGTIEECKNYIAELF
jgi:hypothetical protein